MDSPDRPAIDRNVLSDRLQLALEAPHRAKSWHWLCEAALACSEADRAQTLEAVRRRRPAEGAAAILAATFLDAFGDDESELSTAVHAYLRGDPPLPLDAGLALLNAVFTRALRTGGGAGGFAGILRRAGFAELSQALGSRLGALAGPVEAAAPGGKLRKVALVAPTLSSGYHAPTQMALGHACALVEQGLETTVFAPQEHLMPAMQHWLGAPRKVALAPVDQTAWQRPRRGKMTVTLSKPELSMRGRWLALLEEIARFGPQAVLFVGPYSPLLWPLQARYPVVGVGTNTAAPVGPLDLWLAPSENAQADWGAALPSPPSRTHTRRLSVRISPAALPRPQLGLPKSGVVWMTSAYGSQNALPPQWCARVRAALERHPEATWLVVIGAGTAKVPEHVAAGHPRVVIRGFQKDFGGTLLASDLYLNPPRMGGGLSVASAMAHGVPVLTLPGSDGGDKAGLWAAPDETALFERLEAWTRDPAARREAGAAQRERFGDVFDIAQAGPALLEALAQAIRMRAAG
ncbi:MAG TPA: glycosyltransferase [Burkholderiales bacterium]|nr:glycosyltransferase [Burkholderiales bacterium]